MIVPLPSLPLLDEDEPHPVHLSATDRSSPFLIVCDHAGRAIPRKLGNLGLDETDLGRHIAWDIGAGNVADAVGHALGATVIRQHYSRLVIDCNRSPGHEESIPTLSERTVITGNFTLTDAEREARRVEIFQPYQEAIGAEIAARNAENRSTILIALHSFTPVFMGEARIWQAGVLYNRLPAFSLALRDLLIEEAGLVVGDNEPYKLSDISDYTVPVHAERRNLPYVELEMRQDLIASQAGQALWADLLTRLLPKAAAQIAGT